MNADSIRIECDEDGFHLVIKTELEGPRHELVHSYRITDPEGFYDHVKAAILPWLIERDIASGRMVSVTEGHAYSLNDPKHPRYYSTHVDFWDAKEWK